MGAQEMYDLMKPHMWVWFSRNDLHKLAAEQKVDMGNPGAISRVMTRLSKYDDVELANVKEGAYWMNKIRLVESASDGC